jgi:hypothetical protein
MHNPFQRDPYDPEDPEVAEPFTPLPAWLADRLLRPDEKVTWVRGPRWNPSCERYVTHPALIALALALGVVGVVLGWQTPGADAEVVGILVVAAAGLVLASIFLVGFASGYFTRLVLTDSRLVILQGYEVCRVWGINDLPRSLIRYRRRRGEEDEAPAVDLEAVKRMLGGPSDKFTAAKSILAFGKQLDAIKARERDRS